MSHKGINKVIIHQDNTMTDRFNVVWRDEVRAKLAQLEAEVKSLKSTGERVEDDERDWKAWKMWQRKRKTGDF